MKKEGIPLGPWIWIMYDYFIQAAKSAFLLRPREECCRTAFLGAGRTPGIASIMTWLNKKTILVILAASIAYWCFDTMVEYYFYHMHPRVFTLDASRHELFMRFSIIIVIIAFALT
jgi:hypothetical protein